MELYLKYLAWPGAVALVLLVLGLATLILFRAPLGRLLERARPRERDEPRVQTNPIGQEPIAQDVRPLTVFELPQVDGEFVTDLDSTFLAQAETLIRLSLEPCPLLRREPVLIRFLAANSITQSFDRTYISIWGSQLAVLQFLNPAGGQGQPAESVRQLYEQAAAGEPERYRDYTFDDWLGFLEGASLLDRSDGVARITLRGREFLKYVVSQGYPLRKSG